VKQALADRHSDMVSDSGPFCLLPTKSFAAVRPQFASSTGGSGSPFAAVELYDVTRVSANGPVQDNYTSWTDLALRTRQGWYRYPFLSGGDLEDPHCGGSSDYKIQEVIHNAQGLTVRYEREDIVNPDPGSAKDRFPGRRTKIEYSLTCFPWPDVPPICIDQEL